MPCSFLDYCWMVEKELILVIKRLKRKKTHAGIFNPHYPRPIWLEKIPNNLRHPY